VGSPAESIKQNENTAKLIPRLIAIRERDAVCASFAFGFQLSAELNQRR